MGKWCLQSSTFNFDRIFFKLAGNQDMHKIPDELDFRPNRTIHFRVTCPWVKESLCFDLIFVKLAGNIGAWYAASFKWWPWVDFFLWQGQLCFLMLLYGKIYISSGKMYVISLKILTTNDRSDKMFLLTSKFCPQGVVCPYPEAIYTCIKA